MMKYRQNDYSRHRIQNTYVVVICIGPAKWITVGLRTLADTLVRVE